MQTSVALNRLLIAICLPLAGVTPASAQAVSAGAPVNLAVALDEALKHSPHLAPAEDTADAARIQQTIVASRFAPKISPAINGATSPRGTAAGTFGVSVAQLLPTGATLHGSVDSVRVGAGASGSRDAGYTVTISQPLLSGFGAQDRTERASAARVVEMSTRNILSVRQQLVVDVAQVYFAVLRQQRLLSESERAVSRAANLEEMARARARVGLSTQLDVFRAGLFKSQAQAGALVAADQLAAAGEELSLLLGRRGEALRVQEDLEGDLNIITSGSHGDLQAVRHTSEDSSDPTNRRVDVVDAEARLADAQQRAAAARWSLLPAINLDLTYTRYGVAESVTDPSLSVTNGWRFGFSTTLSLNHASDLAAVGQAAVTVRAAERAVADTRERAEVDVRRAERSVARADEVKALVQRSLDLAGQQRDLAAMRYERGLADNLEVVDAENSVFQAQSALIAADIDRAVSVLLLQRATGALNPDRFLK